MNKPGEGHDARQRLEQTSPLMQDLIVARLSRRNLIKGAVAGALVVATGCSPSSREVVVRSGSVEMGRFLFPELARGISEDQAVADGYTAEVLIRWGDPLFADSPVFDPQHLTAESQSRQFGYNNDFIGFVPLAPGEHGAQRGLLCVNHEYTSSNLMFQEFSWVFRSWITKATCDVELAAHGGSVVEVEAVEGQWRVVVGSAFNRRLMAKGSPMLLTGPAAGHERLRTSFDPTGTQVDGMVNNCAGGITAWHTWLSGEENFDGCFLGEVDQTHPEARNHALYGIPDAWYQWGRFYPGFDVSTEPRSPNHYGWVVEIDPLQPTSTPKKRTALGRLKHEGAESIVALNGRVVVYMGDDEKFEHVYKFVTAGTFNADDRQANADLLDHGTLYVARFNVDGTLNWLSLVHGRGPLTAQNDFYSQADVLIETRRAADLVGATPMDRPEDVQPSPRTGKIYVMLTNNDERSSRQVDAANPRADNVYGHIIEITEAGGDHTAESGRWEILIRGGDPSDVSVGALWHASTSEHGWFGSPDNVAFDADGRMWVATDGNDGCDGLWGVETDGPLRGASRAFYRAPIGAEVCGPCFTPDGQSLFLAIQHPGDGELASYDSPETRWPDFKELVPPRPAVVVIRKNGGTKLIG